MGIKNLLTGKFFENKELTQRSPVFFVILIIGLLYLFSKFASTHLYGELDIVEKELASVTAIHSTIRAKRAHITRESNLLLLIEKNNIDLIKLSDPPIPIK